MSGQWLAMTDDKKPPHPFDLFTELVADLGFVIHEACEVIDWIAEIDGASSSPHRRRDARRKRHLSRIAIVYLSFAAEAAIDLRASAGRMTRQFNAFASGKSPARQLPLLSKGGKKRLAEIAMRLKKARNGIAHPYRVERDGTDRPMTLGQVLSLEAVTAETRLLAEEAKELKRFHSELEDWHGRAFVEDAMSTDWLGGGDYERLF
jgi:hypothetical protein